MMKEPPFRLYDKVIDGIKTEEYQAVKDVVNNPSHYTQGGIECIDAIRAALGPDGFESYCVGNALKYLWRYKHKNGIEDIRKAHQYIKFILGGK
jgi:phosphoribosylformimino-5-aminoimidazole carboxamide ribonucleotide (ProFAR) isomerase